MEHKSQKKYRNYIIWFLTQDTRSISWIDKSFDIKLGLQTEVFFEIVVIWIVIVNLNLCVKFQDQECLKCRS